jgi:hypothetical protein
VAAFVDPNNVDRVEASERYYNRFEFDYWDPCQEIGRPGFPPNAPHLIVRRAVKLKQLLGGYIRSVRVRVRLPIVY